MSNNQRWSWKHLLLIGLIANSLGCGEENSAPNEEPLRAIGGSTDNGRSSSAQDYTDEGVPIVSTDQENQRSQDAQTASGELNCLGVFDCFNACAPEDQTCVDACAQRGTPEARQQLDALALCMQDNECNDNACVEAHCGDELNACGFSQPQDDSGTTSSQSSGDQSLDCQGVYTCFNGCSDGDRDCLDDCFNRGSSAAQAQVNAIGECAQTNGCRDANCVETNCPGEVAACDGVPTQNEHESAPSPNGTLSCPQIFECYGQCARGDQDCLDDCERNGTARAQNQVNAIGACIERNGCRDSECVDRLCVTEVSACNDDSGTNHNADENQGHLNPTGGALTCNEVFECFSNCIEGDRGCLDECYGSGTTAAQDAVSEIGHCVQANRCEDDDCVALRCPEPLSICNAQDTPDDVNSSSDAQGLNCTDVYACFGTCADSDSQCRQSCYTRGTQHAQSQVSAIRGCIDQEDCRDDSCVEQSCYNELTACGFDISPPLLPGSDEPSVDETSSDGNLDEQSNLPENGGVCDAATPLSWGTQTGTTLNAASIFQGSCSGQGAEVVYALTVDSDTVVCLDTFDSNYDTALYVTANTCGGQANEVACNDDTYGIQSQVLFSAEAGVTYYVFVDSYNVSGDFNLTATRGACRDRFGF